MRLDCQLALKVDALLELCYRTYWTRLWIIQELVLSDRRIIQCGSITFDLAIFRRLFLPGGGGIWWEFCRWADDTAAAKMWTSPTMSLFRMNGPNFTNQKPIALLKVMSRNSQPNVRMQGTRYSGSLTSVHNIAGQPFHQLIHDLLQKVVRVSLNITSHITHEGNSFETW